MHSDYIPRMGRAEGLLRVVNAGDKGETPNAYPPHPVFFGVRPPLV